MMYKLDLRAFFKGNLIGLLFLAVFVPAQTNSQTNFNGTIKIDDWQDQRQELSIIWSELNHVENTEGDLFSCDSKKVGHADIAIKAGNKGELYDETHPCYGFEWNEDGFRIYEKWDGDDDPYKKANECNDISYAVVKWSCKIEPTSTPKPSPTQKPTPTIQLSPTVTPTEKPSPTPSEKPFPTESPSPTQTDKPSLTPTLSTTATPTDKPSPTPTEVPSLTPTNNPSPSPTTTPIEGSEPIIKCYDLEVTGNLNTVPTLIKFKLHTDDPTGDIMAYKFSFDDTSEGQPREWTTKSNTAEHRYNEPGKYISTGIFKASNGQWYGGDDCMEILEIVEGGEVLGITTLAETGDSNESVYIILGMILLTVSLGLNLNSSSKSRV